MKVAEAFSWSDIQAKQLDLQTYGYEHILTLHNLEKAGLLKPQIGGRNNYPTIRKTLRLWMDDVNEQVRLSSHASSVSNWLTVYGDNSVLMWKSNAFVCYILSESQQETGSSLTLSSLKRVS